MKSRFLRKAKKSEETGCLEWQGAILTTGYGSFCIPGVTTKAHRASYILFIGDIPKGKCVLHKCHNRKCVNPDHLKLGDQKENSRDMLEAKRMSTQKGSSNNFSRLLETDIPVIRELCSNYGFSQREVAEFYGVTKGCIENVIQGRTWNHI